MVVLNKIYTKTGDDGTTALGDLSRTAKTGVRLGAFADVDEANSSLGVVLALGAPAADVAEVLLEVQNDLFDLGADLCTPVVPDPAYPPLRVTPDYTARLEVRMEGHRIHVPLGSTFADVDDGEFVLVEDSYRHLSLAVNKGDAAARLRARAGSTAIVGPTGG